MKREENQSLWFDVSFPQWAGDDDFKQITQSQLQKKQDRNNKQQTKKNKKKQQNNSLNLKRRIHDQNQIPQYILGESVEKNNNQSQNRQKNKSKNQDIIDKYAKKRQSSRKYRQQKNQYLKSLSEENRFLKFKVEQLSSRIKDLENQLNKLKYQEVQHIETFLNLKQNHIKKAEEVVNKKISDDKLFLEIQSIHLFNSRHQIDYLNYFMGSVLQNMINVSKFYFIDCLINKRGVHRQEDVPPRKIDLEVMQILKTPGSQIRDLFLDQQRELLIKETLKLKEMWKNLYKVYLGILEQGAKCQRILQPVNNRYIGKIKTQDIIEFQIHFERNKYRSDIRFMKNSWFRQIQQEQKLQKETSDKNFKRQKKLRK